MNKKKPQKKTIEKYKRIIDAWFLNGFNGAGAYREFYPTVKATTATVNFSVLQNIDEIRAYIKDKHEEVSKIVGATHEGILKELLNWVQADITETISLPPDAIKRLPIAFRRLITRYKVTNKNYYDREGNLLSTDETVELRLVSKEKAIDMINKHLGFYEADNQQKQQEINIYTSNERHKDIVKGLLSGE